MTLRRPPLSLCLVLGGIVLVAAFVHHLWDGIGIAGFVLFLASIEAKPAWKWFFDAPSKRGGGRFLSWRRVLPVSPQEQRRLPPD
jgi:hypothetical protein